MFFPIVSWLWVCSFPVLVWPAASAVLWVWSPALAHSCGGCGTAACVCDAPLLPMGVRKGTAGGQKTTQQQLSYKFHPNRLARSPTVIRRGPLIALAVDILVP